MALNHRKRQFALAIVAGASCKAAAVAAGYASGSAGRTGWRLMRDKSVMACLEALRSGPGTTATTRTFDDPKEFLAATMNDGTVDIRQRLSAAIALLRTGNAGKVVEGKKVVAARTAKTVSTTGRFKLRSPPVRLVASREDD